MLEEMADCLPRLLMHNQGQPLCLQLYCLFIILLLYGRCLQEVTFHLAPVTRTLFFGLSLLFFLSSISLLPDNEKLMDNRQQGFL